MNESPAITNQCFRFVRNLTSGKAEIGETDFPRILVRPSKSSVSENHLWHRLLSVSSASNSISQTFREPALSIRKSWDSNSPKRTRDITSSSQPQEGLSVSSARESKNIPPRIRQCCFWRSLILLRP